ncbi:MAG TPA: RNA polymerase sigma factor [Blastocatellia bacterium]|nr:RNA polymerase sigma factor [Blastocatellia bacterium]
MQYLAIVAIQNPQVDSDLELARASAAGDTAAFERLYQQYYRRVYSICLRMLGNTSEAEDLTQDVFVQLYRKIGSFRGDSAFTTWLHRMTVNQVLMHFRKRGVRHESTTDDGELPTVVALGTDRPANMPIIDSIAIERAVAELPPGYRTVFVLHDVEGYEHEEIARMLGCTVGTSKSQLHKARLRIRTLLAKKSIVH